MKSLRIKNKESGNYRIRLIRSSYDWLLKVDQYLALLGTI